MGGRSRLGAHPGDALVFADDLAGAAVDAGGPVVDGGEGFEAVEGAEGFGAVVDELPAALHVEVDFALALARSAAVAARDAFGAGGDGTDAGELAQAGEGG